MHGEDQSVQTFVVELLDEDVKLLEQLCSHDYSTVADNVGDLLWYLAHCAADGVRRPGSWERGWIQQATGASL